MTVDPLARLRAADPASAVPAPDPVRTTALLDRIVAQAPPPVRRRRRTRVLGAALGAAVLAGGGSTAYAVLFQQPGTALGLACAAGTTREHFERADGELTSFQDIRSGDPVADCAAEYARREGSAPPLLAYSTGRNHLSVVPADWPVPEHWQRLQGGFRNDAARLELRQRLGDVVDGPESQCRSADEAEALVERDLADLGLSGWTVQRLAQADDADGRSVCAIAFVDDTGLPLVRLQGLPAPSNGQALSDDDPFGALVLRLRRELSGSCLPLPAAEALVAEAVTAVGFDLAEASITALEDPDAACTRADVPVAGGVEVVLRGPAP